MEAERITSGLLWKLPQFSNLQLLQDTQIVVHRRDQYTGLINGTNVEGDLFNITCYTTDEFNKPGDEELNNYRILSKNEAPASNVVKVAILREKKEQGNVFVIKETGGWTLVEEIRKVGEKVKTGGITEDFVLDFLKQVASGLAELEKLGIVNPLNTERDVFYRQKTKTWKVNVVGEAWQFAKEKLEKGVIRHHEVGPFADYQAPELLACQELKSPEHLFRAPYWTLGVYAHLLLFGKRPEIVKEYHLTKHILARQRIDKKPEDMARDHYFYNPPAFTTPETRPLTNRMYNILAGLLSIDPTTRLDAKSLLALIESKDATLLQVYHDPLKQIKKKLTKHASIEIIEQPKSFEILNFTKLAAVIPVFEELFLANAKHSKAELSQIAVFIFHSCHYLLLEYTRIKRFLERAWSVEIPDGKEINQTAKDVLEQDCEKLVAVMGSLPSTVITPGNQITLKTVLSKLKRVKRHFGFCDELQIFDGLIEGLAQRLIAHIKQENPDFGKDIKTLHAIILLRIAEGGFKYLNRPEFRDPSIEAALRELIGVEDTLLCSEILQEIDDVQAGKLEGDTLKFRKGQK